MAPKLPQGLVANSSRVAADIRHVYAFTPEDFKKLWKVYSINKGLLENDVGFRLEHMFWRIWGCERLRSTVTAATVSKLFDEICEGRGFRTTPMPSPRAAYVAPAAQRLLEVSRAPTSQLDRISPEPNDNRLPSITEKGELDENAIEEESGLVISPRRSSRAESTSVQFSVPFDQSSAASKPIPRPDRPKVSVPQSILKNPRQQSQPGTAIDLNRVRGESGIAEAIRRDSSTSGASTTSDVSPSSGVARKPGSQTSSSNGGNGNRRKRTSFAIGSNSRKRPLIGRRKSSRASSVGSTPRPQSFSAPNASSMPEPEAQDALVVEPDFRDSFAKQQRRDDQFFELRRQSNPKTMSTVAATSAAVSGMLDIGDVPSNAKGKGKAKVVVTDLQTVTSNLPTNAELPGEQLSRTKSQLTLLLQRDRQRSGTPERGPLS